MYTKDSLIADIVHALNETNETIETLSRQMSLRNGELSRVLKFVGFEYKKHKWIFSGDDRSLLDLSFKQLQLQSSNNGNTNNSGNKSNTSSNNSNKGNRGNKSNTNNTKSNKHNKGNTSNTDSFFLLEEIQALKELAQLHMQKQFIADTNTSKDSDISILKRVQALQTNGTDRKTYVIDKALIKQFDMFCEKHRLKKSDVMSIALMDLLDKYK